MSRIHIDSFSGPAADLPKHSRGIDDILLALSRPGGEFVSTFDMSEHGWLWRGVEKLVADELVESVDQSYPWHKYVLTDSGRQRVSVMVKP